jgi:hypothetical protein
MINNPRNCPRSLTQLNHHDGRGNRRGGRIARPADQDHDERTEADEDRHRPDSTCVTSQ